MKSILRYILHTFAFYLTVFLVTKLLFLAYNHSAEEFGMGEVWGVLWHGLPMDLSTTSYLIALPWLFCLGSLWWKSMPLKKILITYHVIIGILLALILLGDTLLYEYWKFKLDASIFSYMAAAGGAADSVSIGYIVGGVIIFLLMASLLCFVPIWIIRKTFSTGKKAKRGKAHVSVFQSVLQSLGMILLGGILFVMIRGGVQEGTMNIGTAYHSDKLFLNHAAVNPAFSLFYSMTKYKRYNEQFRFMEAEECAKVFDPLYPKDTEDVTEGLLKTSRPNILYIQLESFGAQFIKELGGLPDVCPNISRFIEEGIFFDNMYANSFRTDRGMVSAISGHASYPTASLMRIPAKLEGLPAIPKALVKEGYDTDYAYGGDITFMGMQGYLISAGFQQLISSTDFSIAQANETKWGVNDSTIMDDAFQRIMTRPADKLWFTGVQTLNSHEPFEVPYHRLEDKVQNAFAYTDHCLGLFVDRLRETPLWDNLLIILMPDHGLMYNLSYEDPEFFHIPMVWMGGAIREPRRIHTLMNQSDFASTLLSQLGISHKEFTWSRNILSRNYTTPFAFCSYPSGIMFTDETGVSVYDITANRIITEEPSPSPERLMRAKAILQSSYDELDTLGPGKEK